MLASSATAGQATFEPDELDEPDELPELVVEELEVAGLLSPELPLLELLEPDDPDESLLDELPDDSLDAPVFSLSLPPPLAATEPFRLSVR
jgi:hypothetical protein